MDCCISLLFTLKKQKFFLSESKKWTMYRTDFSFYRMDFIEVYRNDQIPVSAYIYRGTWSRNGDSPLSAACTSPNDHNAGLHWLPVT